METTQSPSIQDLLFSGADSTDEAGAEDATADEETPPDAATVQEDSVAAEEEDEAELNFRPFTSLLRTGDLGTYLVDAADVETADRFMALPEFQRALPRNISLQWGLGLAAAGRRLLP